MKTKFQQFLKDIQSYVIVVGSYARGTQTEDSDIDFYVRRRPLKEIEANGYEIDEHYMPEVNDVIKKYGFYTTSILIGHVCVEKDIDVPIMTELATHYSIPKSSKVSTVNILGVEFNSAFDVKGTPYEQFLDYEE